MQCDTKCIDFPFSKILSCIQWKIPFRNIQNKWNVENRDNIIDSAATVVFNFRANEIIKCVEREGTEHNQTEQTQ